MSSSSSSSNSNNNYGFDFLKSNHVLTANSNTQDDITDNQNTADDDDGDDSNSDSDSMFDANNLDLLDVDDLKANHMNSMFGVSSGGGGKTHLEEQADVIDFLRNVKDHEKQTPGQIKEYLGIDVSEKTGDSLLVKMLRRNPAVRFDRVVISSTKSNNNNRKNDDGSDVGNGSEVDGNEGGGTDMVEFDYEYAYQSKFPIKNLPSLLALINRCEDGIKISSLLDTYEAVNQDIATLITAGSVIAVQANEYQNTVLFPRVETYLVEMCAEEGGIFPISQDLAEETPGDYRQYVQTSHSLVSSIRRGEAIQVEGSSQSQGISGWYRVSSAVKEGLPLEWQPVKAKAPASVSTNGELSKRNEVMGYVRVFDDYLIPLDVPLICQPNSSGSSSQVSQVSSSSSSSSGGASSGANSESAIDIVDDDDDEDDGNGGASDSDADSKESRPMNTTSSQLESSHSVILRRHGCTTDVRSMYLDTIKSVPTTESELNQRLINAKLTSAADVARKSNKGKRVDLDVFGKVKKKRYYVKKGQRVTNTHLEGTAIGEALAKAEEKQRRGEEVGNGGF